MGVWKCRTSCEERLKADLRAFFQTHLLSDMINYCLAVVVVWRGIADKLKKATDMGMSEAVARQRFTWLNLQAMKYVTVPYAWSSWGGSYVEDFLNLIFPFTLVASFSILDGYLPLLGLIVH